MISKQKILLGAVLILIISFAIFIIATSETLVITISDVNTTAGSQNVSIPINLSNDVNIYGLQLGISHHSDLIFKNISLTSRTNNITISFNDENGEILIAMVAENGIFPGNGTILNLIFDISSSANGTYVLNSTDVMGADLDTELYTIEFIQGNIFVNQ